LDITAITTKSIHYQRMWQGRKHHNAPADMVQAAAEPAERATMATESFMAISRSNVNNTVQLPAI
jgi:hypothetical protein